MEYSSLYVSFVIIEYNCINDIEKCLRSIEKYCYDLRCQIIVSSNSMYPVELQLDIINKYHKAKWIFNPSNGGFAKGMNSGLAHAEGNVVIIMNPDVRILQGNIREAGEFLLSVPNRAILGPKIVDRDGQLQVSCRKFQTLVNMLRRLYKLIFKYSDNVFDKNFDYDKLQPVDWVIGAFMMINPNAMEEIGDLDEGYFLYYEDMDWCKRFWDNGYEIMYYPKIIIEYKGDRKSVTLLSWKKPMNKYTYHHIKSYCRFICKHGLSPSRNKIAP